MARYLISFDDATGRLKRLSGAFYNAITNVFRIENKVQIGPSVDVNTNITDPVLLLQNNDNEAHLLIQTRSNANNPTISFEKRRASGATIQNGDQLGNFRWYAATAGGWQSSSEIQCQYMGDGTSFDTRFIFKVSNKKALQIESDLSVNFFNSTGNSVCLKVHPTSSIYCLTLPETQGTYGQVLTTDGNGNLTWENKVNIDITDHNFITDNNGQDTFDTGTPLTSQRIVVSENGIVKREGVTHDWYRSGTNVIFNYLSKNSWVQVSVQSAVSLSDFHFDVGNSGQTDFNVGVTLSGKRVLVYENGVLKREGASFDYTIAGTIVTMNYSILNSWILIFVYT